MSANVKMTFGTAKIVIFHVKGAMITFSQTNDSIILLGVKINHSIMKFIQNPPNSFIRNQFVND